MKCPSTKPNRYYVKGLNESHGKTWCVKMNQTWERSWKGLARMTRVWRWWGSQSKGLSRSWWVTHLCNDVDTARSEWITTKLSQYLSKPNKGHMTAAKHVLRYLKGTLDIWIAIPRVRWRKTKDTVSACQKLASSFCGSQRKKPLLLYLHVKLNIWL